MMRSMFSGVSGLRAHQTKMDVIGNNIANVNTVGFKGSTVSFQEVFSQTIQGAGSPQGGIGGTNPRQIGLGASVSSMDVNHTKGSTQRTDNPTDLMIDGNGFFAVTNDPTYQNRFYTRAGNFSVDKLGYMVTPGGFKVLGEDFKPIQIDKTSTKTATATDRVAIGSNINFAQAVDPATNIAYTTSVDVYDSLGNVHSVVVNFGEKVLFDDGTNKGSYRNIQLTNPALTSAMGDLAPVSYTPPTANANAYYAKFDAQGAFLGIFTLANGDLNAGGYATGGTQVNPFTMTLSAPGANNVVVPLFDNVPSPPINAFANLTHYASASDAKGKAMNGNASGSLSSFSVSQSGDIIGTYTNGERQTLGTIVLADFDNPVGLQKLGSNMFVDTANSGTPKYGIPGTGSFGALAPGALEMSNVDLSQQFTEMITTQRGFQANSRVITTTDEMLQELVNLKR